MTICQSTLLNNNDIVRTGAVLLDRMTSNANCGFLDVRVVDHAHRNGDLARVETNCLETLS